MGYRHIDTAQAYENHKAVGKALKEFNREEIFITSKYFLDQLNPKKIEAGVQKACSRALKELDLEYLNLFLIHWPDRSFPMSEIVKAMETLVAWKSAPYRGEQFYGPSSGRSPPRWMPS